MLPRIKDIKPMPDFQLYVVFDDGKEVIYDVMDDIRRIDSYKDLTVIHGLFSHVQLDRSRTCVFWTEEIDLPSDTIYEYGRTV